ncbi:MAG: flagellar hook-length control protein FliK, partial [Planctomycetota bacterium]
QPELVAIDPDKSLQAAEADTDANSRQESLKPSNPSGEKPPQAESDLSNTHSIPKPNTKDVQAPTDQTQSRGSGSSNNGSYPESEQIFSQNSSQIAFAEQFGATQESVGTDSPPRLTSTGDVAADVSKQILESVQSSISSQTADRQITIQLNPPELGKVFIKFQEQDAQISGTLEVSKAQTRSEIEQALPQIIQNLTDSGIQIKRLEVMLSQEDQSAQQAFKDPLQQESSFGQHNPADSGSSGNEHETATGTYYGPTNDTGYQSAAELQEILARDDSINFLV